MNKNRNWIWLGILGVVVASVVYTFLDQPDVTFSHFEYTEGEGKVLVRAELENRATENKKGIMVIRLERTQDGRTGPTTVTVGLIEIPFSVERKKRITIEESVPMDVKRKGTLHISKHLKVQPVAGGDAAR